MRIALFDFVVTPHSGPGGCDVDVVSAVAGEHAVTVFASELSLPEGTPVGQVTSVKLPTVRRPSLVAFLTYLLRACAAYAVLRLRGRRFDVRHVTDCSFPDADVCYAHLCHRAYLRDVWPRLQRQRGLRAFHSWANHWTRAVIERRLVARARVVVVPSEGLRRDIVRTYPAAAQKITVIPNAVDLARYTMPLGFRRADVRDLMSTDAWHTAFVFVALGHFERKGLPQLLEALALERGRLGGARLWVVGGGPALVASYRRVSENLGVADLVRFAGRTADVRPFLWSADAFVAPSHYEAFSLALLEAAAAGLPLLATRISGSEDLLEVGINGYALNPAPRAISTALMQFVELDRAQREAMGHAARSGAKRFGPEPFAAAWRELYAAFPA